jgi:hypothetical protein
MATEAKNRAPSAGRHLGPVAPSRVRLDLTAADLASVRWVSDPLREVVASLRVLARPDRHPLHGPLVSLAHRCTSDVDLLVHLVSVDDWLPDFLCRLPTHRTACPLSLLTTIAVLDHLAAQRALDTLRARDAAGGWQGLTAVEFLRRVCDALVTFWHEVLAPLWGRVTDITRADLAHRADVTAAQGLGAALSGLHTRVGIDAPPDAAPSVWQASGSGVWCIPSVFQWPRITLGQERPVPVIVYPARGAARLWESASTSEPSRYPLRQVLGDSRVEILLCLQTPSTTTRIARQLALAPATVSANLTTMTRAQLLTSARHGREVYYARTALADSLVNPDG